MIETDTFSRVTLRDVARAMGISHETVRLALSSSPKIPLARREQVLAVAERLGYQPNASASALSSLKRNSTVKPIQGAVAWLNYWPTPEDLRAHREYDSYWKGARACAKKFGYSLDEFVGGEGKATLRLAKTLFARGINGVLLPPHIYRAAWGNFPWERFATVKLTRGIEVPRAQVVSPNQPVNMMLAFKEIQDRGYRRIGFVGDPAKNRMFVAGFLWAQCHLPPGEQVRPFLFPHGESTGSEAAFCAWLAESKPDAIITEKVELLDMIAKAGLRVPDDIALAATTITELAPQGIDAGIDENPFEVGRVGMLVLLSLINDHAFGIPAVDREVLIKGSWMDGSSLPRRC